jgi:hypothetical protein
LQAKRATDRSGPRRGAPEAEVGTTGAETRPESGVLQAVGPGVHISYGNKFGQVFARAMHLGVAVAAAIGPHLRVELV